MKVKDYKALFDRLDTNKEMDNEILDAVTKSISNEKVITSPRKLSRKMGIATAIIFVFIATISVGATISLNFFAEMFNEEVSQYSEAALYEVENEHGIMRVEQVVTDRINTYLVFSYEMYDERCHQWMNNYFLDGGMNQTSLYPVRTDNGNTKYAAAWSYCIYTAEQVGFEQYETKDKKYFVASIASSGYIDGRTDAIQFEYLLPGRGLAETTTVNINKELPSVVYNIKPHEDNKIVADKLYEPMKVTISSFGISIEGKTLGDKDSWGSEEFYEKWNVDTLYLITKDGHWIDLCSFENTDGGCSGLYQEEDIQDDIDYNIFTCKFEKNINIDDIKGIRLNGVKYYFEDSEMITE